MCFYGDCDMLKRKKNIVDEKRVTMYGHEGKERPASTSAGGAYPCPDPNPWPNPTPYPFPPRDVY